jgi:hypothetical protein
MLAIREERGNDAFPFPLSQRPARTLAIINSLCEESENDTFRFPWSKKPRMDFLRPFQDGRKNKPEDMNDRE